jgi:hypothetical protein
MNIFIVLYSWLTSRLQFVANALTAPPYVLGCISSVLVIWHSDRVRERGFHGAFAGAHVMYGPTPFAFRLTRLLYSYLAAARLGSAPYPTIR